MKTTDKIDSLKMSDRLIRKLKENNINTIGDLLNSADSLREFKHVGIYSIREADSILYQINIDDIENLSEDVRNELNKRKEIANLIYEINNADDDFDFRNIRINFIKNCNLSDSEIKFLIVRLHNRLEDVGKMFNITREQARRIEFKIYRRLRHPGITKYTRGLIPYNKNKIQIINRLNMEDNFFLIVFNTIYGWRFREIYNLNDDNYYIPNKIYVEFNKYILDNINALDNSGYIIKPHNINDNDITVLCDMLNLKFHGGYISNNIDKKYQINYSLKGLNKPVRIASQEDIDELCGFAYSHFGYEKISDRALIASIQRGCKMIKPGFYTYSDDIVKTNKKRIDTYEREEPQLYPEKMIDFSLTNYFFDKYKSYEDIVITDKDVSVIHDLYEVSNCLNEEKELADIDSNFE